MKQYHEMCQWVLDNGIESSDRTGTGTLSVFGYQNRYDLLAGFPLVTTKEVNWKAIVTELLWFLSGDTNVKTLQSKGVSIWNPWADESGDLGPIYGAQWRNWKGIDQIQDALELLQKDPFTRRAIVSAWNVGELTQMALPPCHALFQFYVREGQLSCQLYQRSGDLFLGVPFNIASYALLTHLFARHLNLVPGEFIHSFGDLHIYKNHIEQVKTQLSRKPRELPTLWLNPKKSNLFDFTYADIILENYFPHPAIKGEISV